MADAVGIGLIGTGGVATLHANAINAVEGLEAALDRAKAYEEACADAPFVGAPTTLRTPRSPNADGGRGPCGFPAESRHPAVDPDDRAGRESACRRGEIERGSHDLLRLAAPGKRDLGIAPVLQRLTPRVSPPTGNFQIHGASADWSEPHQFAQYRAYAPTVVFAPA